MERGEKRERREGEGEGERKKEREREREGEREREREREREGEGERGRGAVKEVELPINREINYIIFLVIFHNSLHKRALRPTIMR